MDDIKNGFSAITKEFSIFTTMLLLGAVVYFFFKAFSLWTFCITALIIVVLIYLYKEKKVSGFKAFSNISGYIAGMYIVYALKALLILFIAISAVLYFYDYFLKDKGNATE